jgi:hypothetical protein
MLASKIFIGLMFTGFAASSIAAGINSASPNQEFSQPPAVGQQRREPPPIAYEECKGKNEGDAIQHTLPSGEKVSATCKNSPKGLVARPEHPPRDNPDSQGQASHEPPPSAFEDCKGKMEGAAIQHTIPSGEKIQATCVASPKGLFARPEHPPR